MTTTAASIVNRALAQIAGQYTVSGGPPNFDSNSNAGKAAGILYQPAIETLLRGQDYEFSRAIVVLAPTGRTPPYPWSASYIYPLDCLRIRQVQPSIWDINDPQPVTWDVGTEAGQKVIWTDQASAVLCYTTSLVSEAEFDPDFQESLVRFLGSMLAMALGGRMDLARKMLQDSGGMAQVGLDRDS